MARLTLLVALVVGLACLLGHSRATPLSSGAKDIANAPQIPNFPGPGEIPKPPGMLHSRVTRDVPQEFPKQDQFPPPPPPPEKPSTRFRRDAKELVGAGDLKPSFESIHPSWPEVASREKRAAKGTGGKWPRKAG